MKFLTYLLNYRRNLAKLSERKTVHEWLNDSGTPKIEYGKPICLLRRLSIHLGRHPHMGEKTHPQQQLERLGFSLSKDLPTRRSGE